MNVNFTIYQHFIYNTRNTVLVFTENLKLVNFFQITINICNFIIVKKIKKCKLIFY